jgi:carotenoid cleavage dioxygenase
MMSSRPDDRDEFRIFGVVEEAETGRPLTNLVVRAFDRDLIFDDKIGYTNTGDDGHFEIRFGTERFRELFESQPDLYLRIYDRTGAHLLHETTDAIRWNASKNEEYRIRIPASALV